MNRQERAKQFMAFDALKGLQEELRKKEMEYEEKKKKEELPSIPKFQNAKESC